jgi:hypothetical protein
MCKLMGIGIPVTGRGNREAHAYGRNVFMVYKQESVTPGIVPNQLRYYSHGGKDARLPLLVSTLTKVLNRRYNVG